MKDDLAPSSQQISYLREKISFILQEFGTNQSWLAYELKVTAGAISQWIKAGKVPTGNFKKFCKALHVTRQEMAMTDMHAFEKKVLESFDKKGCVKWRVFINKYSRRGIDVRISERSPSKDPSRSIYVRGIGPESIYSTKKRYQKSFFLDERIDFFLSHNDDTLNDDIEIVTYVLLVEDENGFDYLAPVNQPSKPSTKGEGYFFTNKDGEGYYVNEPAGQHHVYLLLLAKALPQDIIEDIESHKPGRVVDKLADWLIKNRKIRFSLSRMPFFVNLPSPRDINDHQLRRVFCRSLTF